MSSVMVGEITKEREKRSEEEMNISGLMVA